MRIAFITPEFVTEYADGGGLGNYLNRMTGLMARAGHDVEVFVPSTQQPATVLRDGVRVNRVAPGAAALPFRGAASFLRRSGAVGLAYGMTLRAQAASLSAALERRHRDQPFDAVQSADHLAVGLKIKPRPERIHVARCSSAVDLYHEADGKTDVRARRQIKLEFAALRRADKVYAPSELIAVHLCKRLSRNVAVLRPPAFAETSPAELRPAGLPDKYLVHFGSLMERKGTRWLVEALAQAIRAQPDLTVLFVGRQLMLNVEDLRQEHGVPAANAIIFAPMGKADVLRVVRDSTAAVLPSLVDNLPNTVIESLLLGVPVIGTRGASIDELVVDGVTGELVEPGDVPGLAQAMVRAWRGDRQGKPAAQPALPAEMAPANALAALVEFMRSGTGAAPG